MNIVKTISYNVYNRKKWLLYKHLMYHFNCSKTLSILISRVGVAFIQWCSPGMRFASSRKTCNCGSTLFLHSKATYISSSHKSIYAYVCYIYVCIYVHIYIWYILMTSQIQLWYVSPLLPCEAKIYPTHLANWLSLSWILQFSCERFSPLHIKPRESRSTFYN